MLNRGWNIHLAKKSKVGIHKICSTHKGRADAQLVEQRTENPRCLTQRLRFESV